MSDEEAKKEPSDPKVMKAAGELRLAIQEYAQRRAQFCGSAADAQQAQRIADAHIRVLMRACGYSGTIDKFESLTWYD